VAVKTHLGDRRAGSRFQVNGELWASIEVSYDAVLRNMTTNGALLEATVSRDERPIRAASITLPDGGPELTVQVRHVTPVIDAPMADRYLLGVEFVQPSSADRQAIAAFMAAWKQRDVRSS
jgi:hypothetical protein